MTDKTNASNTGKKPLIGIIGGTGQMGKLFCSVFERRGYDVIVASRSTDLTPEKLAQKADVVIVSVPMDVTLDTIRKIAPLVSPESLLMDITSIKQPIVQEMLATSICEVIGTHPVFGPSVNSFRGQTFVLCNANSKKWYSWLKSFLLSEGAIVKETDAKTHDKFMSIVQGMQHFSTIGLGLALKKLDIDPKALLEYSSPIYRIRLDMVGRILAQDPGLYADIELMNPATLDSVNTYLESLKELHKIISDDDRDSFIRSFTTAADHMGSFTASALDETDQLIRIFADKQHMEQIDEKVPNKIQEDTSLHHIQNTSESIITLGPEGTFCHQAALKLHDKTLFRFVRTIDEIFSELKKDDSACALIPIENSLSGSEGISLDMLSDSDATILSEIVLDIDHVLACAKNTRESSLKNKHNVDLFIHPSAFGQCRESISRILQDCSIHLTPSNAESARLCSLTNGSAAVTTELAAKLHNLKIIKKHLQDRDINKTRFFLISRNPNKHRNLVDKSSHIGSKQKRLGFKTSIIVSPISNRPGLLHSILGHFADNLIDLTKIESRPSRAQLGKYVFFIDFLGQTNDAKVQKTLKALDADISNLGSYPATY